MSKWISDVTVGEGGSFGKTNCRITYFHGRVAQVHLNKIPISEVSGGNEYKHGKLYVSPIRTDTRIETEFKMWVRSSDNKDFSWESGEALDVSTGQKLTLMFLNDKFVAYANHNTDSWQYIRTDEKIAKIAGQKGLVHVNGDEIKKHKDGEGDGFGYGVVLGTFAFFMTLFIERVGFWGWDWIEDSSSRLWYALPVVLLLAGYGASRDKSLFFCGCVLVSILAGLGVFFGFQTWAMVILLVLCFGAGFEPSKKYQSKLNIAALSTIKDAMKNNANVALRSFSR